ncbi:hypothetical protein [Streptomyces sp. cmx-4-9]|uniref:hypothetical protein n=1 Tax=Streptomyces sp. cmx-4-9 TaxID=2790941 RepID=UPI0039809BB0
MISAPRPRRGSAVVAVFAVMVVAVAAALGVWWYQGRAQQGEFASAPRPCPLVSAGTADRLLGGRTEAVESLSSCSWGGAGLRADAQPVLQVQVTRMTVDEARDHFRRTKAEPMGKAGPMAADLSDFGDEAFVRPRYPAGGRFTTEVHFRRSNVVVAVRYAPVEGDADQARAGAYDAAADAAARLDRAR